MNDRGTHNESDGEDEVRWTPVVTAPDQLTAEMWQQLLEQEAVPSMLAPHDAISFMGVTAIPVRLLVPAESVPHAQEVLADIMDGSTSPGTDQ